MPTLRALLLALFVTSSGNLGVARAAPASSPPAADASRSVLVIDHQVETIDGKQVKLSQYRGSVLLIVNVASRCGLTVQYEGLEALYRRYKDRGLVILGFPSNDFMGQEPGSNEEIATYCRRTWDVSFPMFAKVHVKGQEMAPLFRALTTQVEPPLQGEVPWNFTKFLVDAEGHVVARFDPRMLPEDSKLQSALEKLLPR
jgi:glutathione peroxidase